MAFPVGALLSIVKNPKVAWKAIVAGVAFYKEAKPLVDELMNQEGGPSSMKLRPVAELRSRVDELEARVWELEAEVLAHRSRVSLAIFAAFGSAAVAVVSLILAII